jgi:hypothetical protein
MAPNHTKVLSLGVGVILAISAAPMYTQGGLSGQRCSGDGDGHPAWPNRTIN